MSENRLGRETSPYLLQHADNPVHWWAWGPDALAEAKRTGKPILLSVGYAACHWCHVMAHESFEDDTSAAVMNELFVNIKVDREERPDIDAIYMGALHRLGERGGWPLTMFLDAEARPFWGGTYFPKTSRHGLPSFTDVLTEIARLYREEPEKISQNAEAILASFKTDGKAAGAAPRITDGLLADVTGRMVGAVDPVHGGLRGAPKFPQWSFFWLLWRGAIRYGQTPARGAVTTTLTRICQGGIYDHLGGGFARYAVDEAWLAPHFEKMLYDNALLMDLLTQAYRETANPLYKLRIEETAGWISREMIADGGGFAASLDADSEGEEGKFYVWSEDEIASVLGAKDAGFFNEFYDVSKPGNWEGHNILNRLHALNLGSQDDEARLSALRDKLLEHRAARIRPGWDDKVLADWNGLMIAALTHAAVIFERADWLVMARTAFDFVVEKMTKNGRLLHAYRAGKAKAPATASDYANMIWAALRLYQATDEPAYLDQGQRWTATLNEHYWEAERGGYAFTADDTPDVILRLRTASDDATPNANGVMMSNLAALHLLTGESAYAERAEQIMAAFRGDLKQNLAGHSGLLAAAYDLLAPQHIVVIGNRVDEAAQKLMKAVHQHSLPGAVEQFIADTTNLPAGSPLSGKTQVDGKPTAFVCIGPQCSLPVTEPIELAALLKEQRMAITAAPPG